MEALLGHVTKFVSNNISIHLYSYPHFSVELVLAVVLCVAHLLLIFEVDKVFQITNAKALAKLRGRQTPMLKEIGPDLTGDNVSYHTISRMETQVYPQKIETTTRQSYYVPFTRKVARKISTRSNVGWLVPRRRSSLFKNPHLDRVEHLLSLSPSEYIRQDKQRKDREAGLRSCIHSLTSLLEKALSKDDLETESKEAIRRSIKNIRANLQYQIGDDYKYINLINPSLNTMVKNCLNRKKPIKNSSVLNSAKGDGSEFEDVSNVGSQDTIDVATSDYSDYYVDRSFEVIHGDKKLRV